MSDRSLQAQRRRLPMLALSPEVHEKCARCGGRCCSYLALEIDAPRTFDEFDDIRWYVAHRGVQVFREGRRWYLQVETRCDHLEEGGLCAIYPSRPKICRSHRVESCEFENPDPFHYSVHFTSSADVERYMRARWPRGRPKPRRTRRRLLPRALRVR